MKREDMADRMEFPETIEEFIKGYSFKDTEELYTNGAELVPVFRVEQALEHYKAKAISEISSNAINEFVKACKEDILCQTFGLNPASIDRIAERLKSAKDVTK